MSEMVRCSRCGIWIDAEECIVNFGVCDSCFEEDCPCNEDRARGCPLHEHPDVVLEL